MLLKMSKILIGFLLIASSAVFGSPFVHKEREAKFFGVRIPKFTKIHDKMENSFQGVIKNILEMLGFGSDIGVDIKNSTLHSKSLGLYPINRRSLFYWKIKLSLQYIVKTVMLCLIKLDRNRRRIHQIYRKPPQKVHLKEASVDCFLILLKFLQAIFATCMNWSKILIEILLEISNKNFKK